jgi:hypothetical protein
MQKALCLRLGSRSDGIALVSLWPRRHAAWRRAPKLKTWRPPAPPRVKLERSIYVTIVIVLALSAAASYTILRITGESQWSFVFFGLIVGSVFAGKLIGEFVWPVLGARFCAVIMHLYVRAGRKRGAKLMITPYADFVPGRLRQTWEAMGFAAGLSLLAAATILFVTQGDSTALPWLSLGGLVLSFVLTFMLVPHWMFARLGLRMAQPHRFVVESLAESYTSWVRVSNGTILLGSAFYGVNALAGRAARLEIYILVILSVAIMLAVSVVAMGTATAYFKRHEERVLKIVAADAKRLGFVPTTHGSVTAV